MNRIPFFYYIFQAEIPSISPDKASNEYPEETLLSSISLKFNKTSKKSQFMYHI